MVNIKDNIIPNPIMIIISLHSISSIYLIIHPMDLVVADNRTVPYIYLLNIIVAEEDLKFMKYVSKHDYSFVPKI